MLRIIQKSMANYFSTLKTSLQRFKVQPYPNLSALYNDLECYEKKLDYRSVLKYEKLLETFNHKIKNIDKKETDSDEDKNNKHIRFDEPLQTNKTYEYFYRVVNQSYNPSIAQYKVKHIPLQQLCELISSTASTQNSNIFYTKIVTAPKTHKGMYEAIKQRMEHIQNYYSMLCFVGYKQFYCKSIEEASYYNKKALKHLYAKDIIYEGDYKFIPNNFTTAELDLILDAGRKLISFNFCSEKVSLFSQQTFLNQNLHPKLTQTSLRNSLYILGYCQTPILDLQPKLFTLFDKLKEAHEKNDEKHKTWWPFQLLFYTLSNRIDNFTLLQQISEEQIPVQAIENMSIVDRQILVMMDKVLQLKHCIRLEMPRQCQALQNIFSEEDLEIKKDFISFLQKYQYNFQITKTEISEDVIVEIEDKKLVNLGVDKFLWNFQAQKDKSALNGKGNLILEYFRLSNQPIKIINPIKILKTDKFTKKQEYFKTKMKGITTPRFRPSKKYTF